MTENALPETATDVPPTASAEPSESASGQIEELNADILDSLGRLTMLIDNRGAWADGIEGCREAVVLLGGMQLTLYTTLETVHQLESNLESARSELERWGKTYAELSAVEKGLRAEHDRLRHAHAGMSSSQQELRLAYERQRTALQAQTDSLANVHALAQELVRESSQP